MPATVFEFRVQYVDDVDPFNVLASIKHAEPTVAKRYKFASDLPLYDQVPAVKKTLRAPHKVWSHYEATRNSFSLRNKEFMWVLTKSQ